MTDDEIEIRALVQRQFDSIGWGEDREPDWRAVHGDFALGAQLWPARRPARPQSAADFTARFRKLREEGWLKSFLETGVGCRVWVVGTMAVALAGCEMVENDEEVTRDISGFLLIRDEEGWKIAAQAWDLVDDIAEAFRAAGIDDA